MPTMFDLFPFYFLAGVLAGCWVLRGHLERGVLIALFLLIALLCHRIDGAVLLVAIGWSGLWLIYTKDLSRRRQIALYAVLVSLGFAFKFHQFQGFSNLQLTDKFWLSLDAPLIGLLPLAFFVPLASSIADWKQALKGWWLTIGAIGLMALVAIASGTATFQFKLPTFPFLRYSTNFFFACIAAEAFYRGFVQNELSRFLRNRFGIRWANGIALVVASAIFTFAHIGWSPDAATFVFIFFAGLLYGGVYLISGKIESAIVCHFLLNATHMTLFSYHAM